MSDIISHTRPILISGASGQLGMEVQRELDQRGIPYEAFNKDDWDITNAAYTRYLINKIDPPIIINCAAYTNVDNAEADLKSAFKVNAIGPGNIADAIRGTNTYLIHISTDYIFSDNCNKDKTDCDPKPFLPTDQPSPESIYAKTKYIGEKTIISSLMVENVFINATIIRTSWLYSKYGKNFVSTIANAIQTKPLVNVVEDQVGRPTWARRLAEFIVLYLYSLNLDGKTRLTGKIIHFANNGIASWYDLANEISDILVERGMVDSPAPIFPIKTEEYPLPAKRPKYSVLDIESAKSIYMHVPHWKDDLNEYFNDLD